MQVQIIQMPIAWHNRLANLAYIEQTIQKQLSAETNLLVLPEMFTSGFTMQPHEVAEPMHGVTINWMKNLAKMHQIAISGSLVISDNSNFYNRMVFVKPDGEVNFYDKKHLFTLAGEDKVYTAGVEKTIVNYQDYKICLQICYDLRFPSFSRNTEDYDVLIYVANWPETRIEAWDTLLKARAIENMCYVIGVNRIGTDARGLVYPGYSKVYDHMGKLLSDAQQNEGIFEAVLDKSSMLLDREKLGFLKDRDNVYDEK